jgi:hypothetical protein
MKRVADRGRFLRNEDGSIRREDETVRSIIIAAIGRSLNSDHLDTLSGIASEAFGTPLEDYRYTNERFDELLEEGRSWPAEVTEDELAASIVLSEARARTLATSIKAGGGLLVSGLGKQLGNARPPTVEKVLKSLEQVGLLERDVVVICQRTSAQTNRVPSRELLTALAAQGMKCACGRLVSDERTEDAVTITERGRELLDGSRWFSILVLSELEKLGVPRDRIVVEQQTGGEEMDCLADISGEIAFFELKDKEFSLGNAYSFGAKMGIVRPQHAIIVTTEHVGADAKEHFDRAQLADRDRARFRGALDEEEARPVYFIEGLENLAPRLEEIVGDIYRRDAALFISDSLPLALPSATALLSSVDQVTSKHTAENG